MIEPLVSGLRITRCVGRNLLMETALMWAGYGVCRWALAYHVELGSLLLLIAAWPGSRKSVLEWWARSEISQWCLVNGIWSRNDLAFGRVVELLITSVSRAGVIVALMWSISSGVEHLPSPWACWLGTAAALLATRGSWAVASNLGSFARTASWPRPTWFGAGLRGVAWVVGGLLAIFGLFAGLDHWSGRWPVGIMACGAAMPALLFWVISEVEPITPGGRVLTRETKTIRIRRSRFNPLIGLAWSGAKRVLVICAVAALALSFCPIVADIAFWFHRDPEVPEPGIQFLSVLLLIYAAACVQFRWHSFGQPSEFLSVAGVRLKTMRRVELFTGLAIGLEILLVAYLSNPGAMRYLAAWIVYALLLATALLLCNQAPSPILRARSLRVRELFPWSILVMTVGTVLVLIASRSDEPALEKLVTLIAGLVLGGYVVGSFTLWIRALAATSDEDALRRAELDPEAR